MQTTLNKIRARKPCATGWKKLLRHMGKTTADDESLHIKTILESNGLNDALWCLRAVAGRNRDISLYAVWCARQVQHLMADLRSSSALGVVERFSTGKATKKELDNAADAAWSAADAAWSAADAAWDAQTAAWAASRGIADAATAWIAARSAAFAASAAAYAASYVPASVWSVGWSATSATSDDARHAARAAQTAQLIELCGNNK